MLILIAAILISYFIICYLLGEINLDNELFVEAMIGPPPGGEGIEERYEESLENPAPPRFFSQETIRAFRIAINPLILFSILTFDLEVWWIKRKFLMFRNYWCETDAEFEEYKEGVRNRLYELCR